MICEAIHVGHSTDDGEVVSYIGFILKMPGISMD
jgi:hypothetical protein